jgi:hypothetical protein
VSRARISGGNVPGKAGRDRTPGKPAPQEPRPRMKRDAFARSGGGTARAHVAQKAEPKAQTYLGARPPVFSQVPAGGLWAALHNAENLQGGMEYAQPPSLRVVDDLNRTSATGEDMAEFFSHLHEKAAGHHVYLDLDTHGGGGNGVVFTTNEPGHAGTRVLNVYSFAYVNHALAQAGFKPDEVTVLYEGCNAATASYRTAHGFSPKGQQDLVDKERRWQAEDDPGVKEVKIIFHDVPEALRPKVEEFPAVGRMNENNVSVAAQFRLGIPRLINGKWTTGIYWIDHQKRAPRYLESAGSLDHVVDWEFYRRYEERVRAEQAATAAPSSRGDP